jgi:hypothetical protein
MLNIRSNFIRASLVAVLLAAVLFSIVWAGTTVDRGQITGLPAQANYLVFYDGSPTSSTPPLQILTEDGFNSAVGLNQGYQSQIWSLNAQNFAPPPAEENYLHFFFGGLGADAGKVWTYDPLYDPYTPITDHGAIGALVSSTSPCPTMLQGSFDGAQKVIRWLGVPGSRYYVFRSLNPSGTGNGASNGRYSAKVSVTLGPTTNMGVYTYTNTSPSWHIVVPADLTTGAIIGCHSEESNPTAVTLRSLSASSRSPYWPFLAGLVALTVPASVLLRCKMRRN